VSFNRIQGLAVTSTTCAAAVSAREAGPGRDAGPRDAARARL